MNRFVARLALAASLSALLLAGGCATPSQWERYTEPKRVESPKKSFSLEVPVGWRRAPDDGSDRVLLTADGTDIQLFLAAMMTLDEAFSVSKVKGAQQSSPRELGELVLAELRSILRESQLELKAVGETRIGGRPAFRLHLAERTPAGVPYERIVYGTQGESKMIWVTCKALSRHFFEKARPACEQALASVRIVSL